MKTLPDSLLEEAKRAANRRDFANAYHPLKRLFDRLPFGNLPEHTDYVGIFARLLADTGRRRELEFYRRQIYALREKYRTPDRDFLAGFIDYYLEDMQSSETAESFKRVIFDHPDPTVRTRSQMLLANYYYCNGIYSKCGEMISAVSKHPTPELEVLTKIWLCILSRTDGKLDRATSYLESARATPQRPHAYFEAFYWKIQSGILAITQGDMEYAQNVTAELRRDMGAHSLVSISDLSTLENLISQKREQNSIALRSECVYLHVSHRNTRVSLRLSTHLAKLLLHFLRTEHVTVDSIVEELYRRKRTEKDAATVHYYIYRLRTLLRDLGLPEDALTLKGDRYCLRIPIRIVEGSQRTT